MNNRTRTLLILVLLIGYGVFLGWVSIVYRSSLAEQYSVLNQEFEKSLDKQIVEFLPVPPMAPNPSPRRFVSLEVFFNQCLRVKCC